MLHPWISLAKTDYGGIILDKKRGEYWQINPAAYFILEKINSGYSLDELPKKVSENFPVSCMEAQKDINELLDDLKAAKVIKNVER